MNMVIQPEVVFFDLDETLVENKVSVRTLFRTVFDHFEDQLGNVDQDQFFAKLGPEIAGLWNAMFTVSESPESQLINCFQSAVDAFTPTGTNQNLGETMFNRFVEMSSGNVQLHSGVEDTLIELSRRGYGTGIITNGIEQLQLGKIRKLELDKQVDHVVVSAQARAHKPHQPVFDLALSRAGVKPHEAWQIGDHPTNDVAGSIRAGMSGIYFDPNHHNHKAFEELEERPLHIIRSIPEVLSLLD